MSTAVRTAVTTTALSPSWYDVLDVGPSATDAEIRAAWRTAIADLVPTDRRFRLLNQAAEVLLDPAGRAAYDEGLAAVDAGSRVDDDGLVSDGEPEQPASVRTRRTRALPGWLAPGRVVPGWLLVAVAVVAALVVGACAVVAATAPSDASIADATRQAQSAAERAIVPILSYDGTSRAHLDADEQAAEGYLTSDYREQYAKLFEVIKANAPRTGTKVTAEVVASGIVRSGRDRVAVLVFVNRPTTNKQLKQPVVYKDQVTVTMQKVGDDWLVDDLVTSPAAG
jgi:Mce-associated membrane protein